MSSYWINFVKYGNPNGCDSFGNELPEWEAYTDENEFVLEFKDIPFESAVKIDPIMKFRMDYTINTCR